jgi:hypothetical protein
MFIQPDPTVRGAEAIRQDLLRQAETYLAACGVQPPDLKRLAPVFQGPSAPCALKTGKLHLAHVNTAAEKRGILLDRLSGHLVVEGGDREKAYAVVLREEGEQHLFLVAVERMGTVTGGSATTFWSYSLLCLETEGEENPALVIALDLANDGESLQLQTSRRLYLQRRRHPVSGAVTFLDRLATLEGRANLEGVLTHVMAAEGFPYQEARINRATPAQLAERRRGVPAPPSLLPAGIAPGLTSGVVNGSGYPAGPSMIREGGPAAQAAFDPFRPGRTHEAAGEAGG